MANQNRFIIKNGLDNSNKTITNVLDPVNAQDAATKAYADTKLGLGSVSSGTANGVVYLNGSKAPTTGNALTFDGSKLTSSGNIHIAGNNNSLRFTDNGGTERVGVRLDTDNLFAYGAYTLGHKWLITDSEQMRLTSTGLGIGTSSPAYKLEVNGTLKSGTIYQAFAQGVDQLIFRGALGSRWEPFISYKANGSTVDRGFRFGALDNNGQETEWLRIWDGNVGIGTNSPSQKLHVASAGAVVGLIENTASALDARLRVKNTQASLELGQDSTGGYIQQTGAYPLVFHLNSSERMRLDASGNLGIGKSPSYKFDVQSGNSGRIAFTAPTADHPAIYFLDNAGGYQYGTFRAYDFTFNNGTSDFLKIDSVGNVGIGTSSPGAKLDVIGGTNVTGGWNVTAKFQDPTSSKGLYLGYNGGNSNAILAAVQAGAGLEFWTYNGGWASRLNLDSSGNLGLGVTPSAWDSSYKVLEAGYGGNAFVSNSGMTQIGVVANGYWNGNWKYKNTGNATLQLQQNGQHQFWIAPSGTAGNAISFTQAMTLDASGNLGIGTSSPIGKLDVRIGSYTDPNNRITFQNSVATGLYIGTHIDASGSGVDLASRGYSGVFGDFRFISTDGSFNGATERMRIDSAGNLGLGVTPSAWNSSWKAFQTTGGALWSNNGNVRIGFNSYLNSAGTLTYIQNGYATDYQQGAGIGSHIWYTAPSGNAGDAISFTQAMTLDASGNLAIGINSPITKLHVNGSIALGEVTGTNNLAIILANDPDTHAKDRVPSSLRFGSGANVTVHTVDAGQFNDSYLTFGTHKGGVYMGERMRLDSSGNLGLGVTPSGWRSSADRTIQVRGAAFSGYNNYAATITNNAYLNSSSSWTYLESGVNPNKFGLDNGGGFSWHTAPSGTAGDAISFTQAMTLDASGNLGIGTTNTTTGFRLTVRGASGFGGIIATAPSGHNGIAHLFGIDGVSNGYQINCDTNNNVSHVWSGNGGTERLRIDSAGNLGLGVVPSGWDTSIKAIEITGASLGAQSAATWLLNNAYVTQGGSYKYKNDGVASGILFDASGIHFLTAPSSNAGNGVPFVQSMQLDTNSNLTITGSLYAASKSFLIDHPTKPGKKLQYGSLESPYHGVRLTGEATIKTNILRVDLPDYIHGLCKAEGSQVQLTNIKHGKVLWIESINVNEDYFEVAFDRDINDTKEYSFYWSFTAIRKDIEELVVEF